VADVFMTFLNHQVSLKRTTNYSMIMGFAKLSEPPIRRSIGYEWNPTPLNLEGMGIDHLGESDVVTTKSDSGRCASSVVECRYQVNNILVSLVGQGKSVGSYTTAEKLKSGIEIGGVDSCLVGSCTTAEKKGASITNSWTENMFLATVKVRPPPSKMMFTKQNPQNVPQANTATIDYDMSLEADPGLPAMRRPSLAKCEFELTDVQIRTAKSKKPIGPSAWAEDLNKISAVEQNKITNRFSKNEAKQEKNASYREKWQNSQAKHKPVLDVSWMSKMVSNKLPRSLSSP